MWEFREIDPCPARGYEVPAMWDSPRFIAEVKEDGDRRIAQFCGLHVRFTGRVSKTTGKVVEKTHNLPHLRDGSGDALVGTVLDGEIVVVGPVPPGGRSKHVTSIMGSKPELAIEKQKARGWLHYRVFDCLYYMGEDIRQSSLLHRQNAAQEALRLWGNPYAHFIEQEARRKREFYKKIVAEGGEGVILKDLQSQYGNEKAWAKVKAQWTADVVIIGYKEAKAASKKKSGEVSATKYAEKGLIGAIRVGQYLKGKMIEVASISGIDDDLRKQMTRTPNAFLDKVVTIEHNGREPTLRFRHPRFSHFRDDKGSGDCIVRPNEV
jgi:ATP-dependent DNA ligase